MEKTTEPQILIIDAHGQYIPQLFCQSFLNYVANKNELQDEIKDCLEGPDNENYFDSWLTIEREAKLIDDNNTELYLYQNGDLWAIPLGYENVEFFEN